MRALSFVLLLVSLSISKEITKTPDFAIEVIQSPHTLKSFRIASTIIFDNWRFSPGSYLYLEMHGEVRHSVDPLFGIALAALVLKVNKSTELGIGDLSGLIILGGLTCIPNAEYTVPVSLVGINPSIFWSYNLLPVSWRWTEIQNVKKIGIGFRKRIGRFDFAIHSGVSDQGFQEKLGPTFGASSTFFIGKFGFRYK